MHPALKIALCLRQPTFRRTLVLKRVAAGVEHLPVLRELQCNTVVDVGANKGQFALAARSAFPTAKLICFEPLPNPARVFRSLFSSDHRVTLHQVAIGEERGQASIFVSGREDSSSLLPITELQNAVFPGTAAVREETIQVGQLADFVSAQAIHAPALLKLDVQGFELQALKGCEALLEKFAHAYVESSFQELYKGQSLADEVVTWLRQRGLKLRGVFNTTYDADGKAIQADFLFGR